MSDNVSARDAPGAENREPRAASLRQRFQGDIDIRIATDGTWLYAGTPIERIELVKLFATMLKRDEGGDFWLETPEEKARIAVDDAPFTIVAMNWTEDEEGKTAVTLRTNLDEEVALDEKHPLWMADRPESEGPRPYVAIEKGLNALITRSVYHEMVNGGSLETLDGEEHLGLWSKGRFFSLGATGTTANDAQ